MIKIILMMIVSLLIISCGGGGYSGGFPTKLNENATALDKAVIDLSLNDNATTLNDNATIENKIPLLEEYIEHYVDYNRITLFWKSATDSDGSIEEYAVSYRLQEGEWSQEYYNVLENYTFYLDYNQSYQFRIRAKDNQGAYSSYIYSEVISIAPMQSHVSSRVSHLKEYRNAVTSLYVRLLDHRDKDVLGVELGVTQERVEWVGKGVLVSHIDTKREYFDKSAHFKVLVPQENRVEILLKLLEDIALCKEALEVLLIDSSKAHYYLDIQDRESLEAQLHLILELHEDNVASK
jgi:coenzyme F420-reducing hydrogenase delta subunit